MIDSSGTWTPTDTLKAISYEDTYAGRIINFEVAAFDVRSSGLKIDVEMGIADYAKTGALFVTPDMKLDTLSIVAAIPSTKLSYTVEMLDLDLGTGQIKFSHAINMVWLENNFSSFFRIYLLDKSSGVNKALLDIDMKFDSENDGRVVDFTVSGFEADDETLTVDIAMDQEDYSKADALFVLTAATTGFELSNVVYSATVPGSGVDLSLGGGIYADGDGSNVTFNSRNNPNSDDDNDDDDDDTGLLIGLFVFIGCLLICVIVCFSCCACCPYFCCWRRDKEDKVTTPSSAVVITTSQTTKTVTATGSVTKTENATAQGGQTNVQV